MALQAFAAAQRHLLVETTGRSALNPNYLVQN